MPDLLKVCGCLALVFLAGAASPAPAAADERLQGIACRSVHLQYSASDGTAFTNEIVVEHSAPGTYFCVCGFNHGYFGLQELANGKKLLIFSVWDPGRQNDPNSVQEQKRVKLVYQDEQVRIGRFGGEGTGGQSFYDFDWQPGTRYRLLVTAAAAGPRTEFSGWFFAPDAKAWKKLVTFSTLTGGQPLKGYYAFVEDFRRNRESTQHARRARFGNGWVLDRSAKWHALDKATFTADNNPVQNIDAGLIAGDFFLATGGKTENRGTPLGKPIESLAREDSQPPGDLPDAGSSGANGAAQESQPR